MSSNQPQYVWNNYDFNRLPSTYTSYNSSYISKSRHVMQVKKRGKTSCWICHKKMTIFPRGRFLSRIVHYACKKMHEKTKKQ